MSFQEKTQRLDRVAEAIHQRWGNKVLQLPGVQHQAEVQVVATPYLMLNQALGIGGIPRRRVTEIMGAPTSGVSTLALGTIARAQAAGDMAVYMDLSHTFDAVYAAASRINLEKLLLVRPKDMRQALYIAQDLIATDGAGILIFDVGLSLGSEAALSEGLSALNSQLARSPCALIFLLSLNRVPASTSSPYPGGSTLAHYASLRLRLERERWLHKRQEVRGYRACVNILKNKLAPPSRAVRITIPIAGD